MTFCRQALSHPPKRYLFSAATSPPSHTVPSRPAALPRPPAIQSQRRDPLPRVPPSSTSSPGPEALENLGPTVTFQGFVVGVIHCHGGPLAPVTQAVPAVDRSLRLVELAQQLGWPSSSSWCASSRLDSSLRLDPLPPPPQPSLSATTTAAAEQTAPLCDQRWTTPVLPGMQETVWLSRSPSSR